MRLCLSLVAENAHRDDRCRAVGGTRHRRERRDLFDLQSDPGRDRCRCMNPTGSSISCLLVRAAGPCPAGRRVTCDEIFSYPMFRDLERVQTVFTGIAAHRDFGANVAHGGVSEGGDGMLVSGSYFPRARPHAASRPAARSRRRSRAGRRARSSCSATTTGAADSALSRSARDRRSSSMGRR